MTGLSIYSYEDRGVIVNPPFSWQFSLPAVPMHLPPMERICSQDPLELSESPPMKPIPPSRQERLSEARCMQAHATGMWVFLWANILVNPKQQALQYVFGFCGTSPPTPPLSSALSFQGVPQHGVCSDVNLLGSR